MGPAAASTTTGARVTHLSAPRAHWLCGWTLLAGLYAYLFSLRQGARGFLLVDGDTYWHIAAGRWILEHGRVPTQDPFSHSVPGGTWTAHEWLSEIVLALAHDSGGWTAVAAVTSLAFAAAIALMMRALLRWLPPVRALLLVVLAVLMTGDHLLARPHILAMPLMLLWMAVLVGARDAGRAPPLWLLPVMTLWANMHGGFTLGLAMAGALAAEAFLDARRAPRNRRAARHWALFVLLATGAAMLTPLGPGALWFTWEVMSDTYALSLIGEWRSPNFHRFQPLMLWLLLALAVSLHQGLRLPPVRLALVLGLVYLSLKHARNIELLGLLGPLLVARSVGTQWQHARSPAQRRQDAAAPVQRLSQPVSRTTLALCLALLVAAPLAISRLKPPSPPPKAAPAAAVDAALAAGADGPVLNEYSWGGYLIYRGIRPYVDGRADLYGEKVLREYRGAVDVQPPEALEQVLDKYRMQWTLLPPTAPAVAVLDRLPQWQRIHADKTAVVHMRRPAH